MLSPVVDREDVEGTFIAEIAALPFPLSLSVGEDVVRLNMVCMIDGRFFSAGAISTGMVEIVKTSYACVFSIFKSSDCPLWAVLLSAIITSLT